MHQNKNHTAVSKRDWVQPELRRLEAGAAESQRGATPDGGGGNQGS
jgi:hypothetical protein